MIGLDKTTASVHLTGGDWQEILLYPTDFVDAEGQPRTGWEGIKELKLGRGSNWPQDVTPEFRNLRWIEGTEQELGARLSRQVPLEV